MKKIISCFLLLFFIFSLVENVNAYSTNQYSIDVPSTYRMATEGSFTKENGNNVNIQITPFSESSKNVFTEEGLETLTNNINSKIDTIRSDLKKTIKERYGEYLSDTEIEEYVNSFKCDSIDKKEISTATKNNYKCYHIIASYSSGDKKIYEEQYTFVSDKNIYTLTVSVSEKNDLESTEIKNIINSFTISNYKDPEKSSFFSEKLLGKIVATAIVTIICGIIEEITRKKKKQDNKNKKGTQQSTNNEQENENLNNIANNIEQEKQNETPEKENLEDKKEEEKKYCTNCGRKIENEWIFCNYCGNKLK